MPTQVERVEAYAGHLLDAFLALRERHALLDPMLFNESVAKGRGSGRQARGFRTLRTSLFFACAQDIAKLVADGDPRTPSVRNIAAALRDHTLVASLRPRLGFSLTARARRATPNVKPTPTRRPEMAKQRSLLLKLTSLALVPLASGCATPSAPLQDQQDRIPALPPQGRVSLVPIPSDCLPTCLSGLTRERNESANMLTTSPLPAAPASAPTTR